MGRPRTKTRRKIIQKRQKQTQKSFSRYKTLKSNGNSTITTEEIVEQGGPRFQSSKTGCVTSTKKNVSNSCETTSDDDDFEWNINQLLCGDGSKALNGKRISKNKLYASGHANGDINSFFEIDEESLGLNYIKGRFVYVQGKYLTPSTIETHGSDVKVVRIDTDVLRPDGAFGFTDEIIRCVKNHKGFSIRLNVPGYRENCEVLQTFLLPNLSPLFSHGADKNCLVSASLNIVYAAYLWRTKCHFEARKAAEIATEAFDNHQLPLYTVASTTPVFHRMKIHLDVKKFPREKYGFKWLSSLRGDRFLLLRIFAKKTTDHVIAVDVSRKCVFDNYEVQPLQLCEEVLDLVGGGCDKNPKAIEVREVFFTK